MNRFRTLTTAIVLAVALGGPAILAAGPGSGSPPTTTDGTVTFVNIEQGILQLNDGTELRTTDRQQLKTLKVGDHVRVSYEDRNGRNYVLSITASKSE